LTGEQLDFIEHPTTLSGYVVHAVDGRLGVVVDASPEALIVRRPRLMFMRHRVLIPARAVDRIDLRARTILLNRTRQQVSRIPQPKGRGAGAWFLPGSMRIPSTSPVIGVEPPSDHEDRTER
jgi:hypothetical protein